MFSDRCAISGNRSWSSRKRCVESSIDRYAGSARLIEVPPKHRDKVSTPNRSDALRKPIRAGEPNLRRFQDADRASSLRRSAESLLRTGSGQQFSTVSNRPTWLSTVFHKYDHVCCAAFGLGLGATKEHTRQGSVTEEQQRPKPNATQPSGRQVFSNQTSLLAPYRPLTGMLVARAS